MQSPKDESVGKLRNILGSQQHYVFTVLPAITRVDIDLKMRVNKLKLFRMNERRKLQRLRVAHEFLNLENRIIK
jgi:hypothetical protein